MLFSPTIMDIDADDDVVEEIKPVMIAEVDAAVAKIREQLEHCMDVPMYRLLNLHTFTITPYSSYTQSTDIVTHVHSTSEQPHLSSTMQPATIHQHHNVGWYCPATPHTTQ